MYPQATFSFKARGYYILLRINARFAPMYPRYNNYAVAPAHVKAAWPPLCCAPLHSSPRRTQAGLRGLPLPPNQGLPAQRPELRTVKLRKNNRAAIIQVLT